MKIALAALLGSLYIATQDLFEIQVHRAMSINPIEVLGVLASFVWARRCFG